MARSSNRETCSDDEEWSSITDPIERRKIQNRNNQRAFRKRRQQEKQLALKASSKDKRRQQPLLLPKLPVRSKEPELPGIHVTFVKDERRLDTQSVIVAAPKPISIHDVADTELDLDARRIFQYASQCLWDCFCQQVVETNESVAAALTRLSFSNELIMQTFLWTAANELETHSHHRSNARVMHRSQNRAIELIRQNIAANKISDELVFAVYALVSSQTPANLLQEEGPSGTGTGYEVAEFGDFHSPFAASGWSNYLSQFSFADVHAEMTVQLLDKRGGLESIVTPGLADQMQAVDLLRSSQKGTRPAFGLCKEYQRILHTEVPIYRAGGVVDYPLSSQFFDLFLDLRCYVRQVELLLERGSPPAVPAETLVAWRNINQHRLLSLSEDEDPLYRLTALLFSYNVTFPVAYHEPIERFLDELIEVLLDIPEDTASEAAIWATVIAGMSNPGSLQLRALHIKAKELQSALGIETWEEVKPILSQYLWMESACDESGRNFWEGLNVQCVGSIEDDFPLWF